MERNQYEARFLEAGLEQLKPYLLSGELFWNLGLARPKGWSPYPQLTLGNLLLSAHILACLPTSESAALLDRFDSARQEWASAWNQKAAKEYSYRLKQWHRALEDFQRLGPLSNSGLATEARNRVIVDLLGKLLPDEELAHLGSAAAGDSRFKRLTKTGEFLWDIELVACFTPEPFWFLYRRAA